MKGQLWIIQPVFFLICQDLQYGLFTVWAVGLVEFFRFFILYSKYFLVQSDDIQRQQLTFTEKAFAFFFLVGIFYVDNIHKNPFIVRTLGFLTFHFPSFYILLTTCIMWSLLFYIQLSLQILNTIKMPPFKNTVVVKKHN